MKRKSNRRILMEHTKLCMVCRKNETDEDNLVCDSCKKEREDLYNKRLGIKGDDDV